MVIPGLFFIELYDCLGTLNCYYFYIYLTRITSEWQQKPFLITLKCDQPIHKHVGRDKNEIL